MLNMNIVDFVKKLNKNDFYTSLIKLYFKKFICTIAFLNFISFQSSLSSHQQYTPLLYYRCKVTLFPNSDTPGPPFPALFYVSQKVELCELRQGGKNLCILGCREPFTFMSFSITFYRQIYRFFITFFIFFDQFFINILLKFIIFIVYDLCCPCKYDEFHFITLIIIIFYKFIINIFL